MYGRSGTSHCAHAGCPGRRCAQLQLQLQQPLQAEQPLQPLHLLQPQLQPQPLELLSDSRLHRSQVHVAMNSGTSSRLQLLHALQESLQHIFGPSPFGL